TSCTPTGPSIRTASTCLILRCRSVRPVCCVPDRNAPIGKRASHRDMAAVRPERQADPKTGTLQVTVGQCQSAAQPFDDAVADVQPQPQPDAGAGMVRLAGAHKLLEDRVSVPFGDAAAVVGYFHDIAPGLHPARDMDARL